MKNQILHGDVLEVAKTLASRSVNCVVTSPPYYGLRDYDLPPTHWPEVVYGPMSGLPSLTVPFETCCLGLEKTIESYVGHMVLVFRELRRALRGDGVAWLNLGDSYANSPKGSIAIENSTLGGSKTYQANGTPPKLLDKSKLGVKPKNLIGIPWRVALALQADGWYLRSEIIWHKKNQLPESMKDRPTKAHEQIFLLTKKAKYWYDQDAIREPHKEDSLKRYEYGLKNTAPKDGFNSAGSDTGSFGCEKMGNHMNPQGRNRRTVWAIPETTDPLLSYLLDKLADDPEKLQSYLDQYADGASLKSDVWEVATKPFKGAHFACFPPALIEPCILAGCPSRVCVECGEPWVRIVEKTGKSLPVSERNGRTGHNGQPPQISGNYWEGPTTKPTNTFIPTCQCSAPHRPGIVLDPFLGSGTTAQVAEQTKRDWLGMELNPKYIKLAEARINAIQPTLFAR